MRCRSKMVSAAAVLLAGAAVAAALATAGPTAAAAGTAAGTAAGDASGFERLKSLAGEWEGKNREGQPARATYEVTANGSAVVETLSAGEMHSMITVYHRDGDRLMMTHYCGAGNQPRMRSEKAAEPGVLRFAFVDATNLPGPDAGHMHRLALRFPDPGHLRQEWTWTEKGQEKTEVIELARKK